MRFIVELFLSRASSDDIDKIDARARAAAAELAREGAPVRHLRSTHVPEDEMCLLLYEAPNRELALEASRRAGVTSERVLEAIEAVQ
jgi:uncharacterized protein DUF4242